MYITLVRQCHTELIYFFISPRWRAADAEIKVPSDENAELKDFPFKSWSRSVYCHACYTYCQGIPTLPVHSPAFFAKPFRSFSCVSCGWFLCRPTEYKLAEKTPLVALQWGAADAEIKVPSNENTELKHSPFKAWSRSVYSHSCYACCQGFLPG